MSWSALLVVCQNQPKFSYIFLSCYFNLKIIEKEFSGQLETLRSILKDRGAQFEVVIAPNYCHISDTHPTRFFPMTAADTYNFNYFE